MLRQRFLVALVFALMDEHVPGPAELVGHVDVELALQRVFALIHNGRVVAPGNFSNQWLEFFKVAAPARFTSRA